MTHTKDTKVTKAEYISPFFVSVVPAVTVVRKNE